MYFFIYNTINLVNHQIITVNIIKFQNRETEDLSVYDAVILLSLSVEYN
jgi:hypothetical protein